MKDRREVVSTRLGASWKRRLKAVATAEGVTVARIAESLLVEGICRRLEEHARPLAQSGADGTR